MRFINPPPGGRTPLAWRTALALAASLLTAAAAHAQVPQEQAAQMTLTAARKAYNEKNYAFAVGRFREFLQRFGGHKEAPSARYGLALSLIEAPEQNVNEARDLLQALSGDRAFADHPGVLYHLGLALRAQGIHELALANAKPSEAAHRQGVARDRFGEAAKQYAAAAQAYADRAGAAPEKGQPLPADLEWSARARCDEAEMLLRTEKAKEAQAATAGFLKDAVLSRSRSRDLGRYYHGYASFLLQDYKTAEPTLAMLAPFSDPIFGTHARYLLAQTHHRADERAEAAAHYEGVLAGYLKNKQAAVEALKRPETFRDAPAERARLEALVREPPPDHVGRAVFHHAVLLYEGGKFGDALSQFAEFPKLFPNSTLRNEAQLRLGFCQVQTKAYADALHTLQPLADREPKLADQALLWTAKARIGAADPGNPQAFEQAVRTALDLFRLAGDKARQAGSDDADVKARRGEVLVEVGDAQQLIKQYKEAAQSYNQALNEKLLPQREEELGYRLATALHLAGDLDESDNVCQRLLKAYPKSILRPAVLFRHAENGYFRMLAAEKAGKLSGAEMSKLYDETVGRYDAVVSKYPEFPQVNLARYGMALAEYRRGDLLKARETLEAIPQSERSGELSVVSYLIADCLLRLVPSTVPEDALAAGKLEEQLKTIVEMLEAFLGAQPNAPEVPDALLRLGLAQQRMAALLAQPPDRAKALTSAREAYEKLIGNGAYARHPGLPQARLERAKCIALAGDVGGATNELRAFTQDPLKHAPVAPMALLHLSTLLRGQNRAAEAADLLKNAREQYEPVLAKDPARASWVTLLRYHHGLALREAGKLPEARAALEEVVKQGGNTPEVVEAALRAGQCLKDEAAQKLAAAHKARESAHTPEQKTAAGKLRDDGIKLMGDAVGYLEAQAKQLQQKQPEAELRARMMYEVAWGYRELARPEVEAAREAVAAEKAKKQKLDPGKHAEPAVALAEVPLQPAEQKARAEYQALLQAFPDLPLANEARFELAELYQQRDDHDQALKLLTEAMDKEPTGELADKVRIRLGAAQFAKGNVKGALAHFDAVAQNPKSALAGQAHYRAAECLLEAKQWAEAAKRLSVFRDNPQFHNLPGLSDRALLRLGHAYAHLGDWEASRQAMQEVVNRFGSSRWASEGYYGVGWALQQQKHYDQAVDAYRRVLNDKANETAARAQLQIGLCRLDQKRFAEAGNELLIVPFTYDFPELKAVALLEAARSFIELNQKDQARHLLQRVIRDHPDTSWAQAARDRLATLKGS